MKIKRLLVLMLALSILTGLGGAAEVQYITDIQVSVRALDGSAPEPTAEPTLKPTAEPTPEPAPDDVPADDPEPSATPEHHAPEYEIEVDLNNQIVTVYRAGGRTAGDIARQMICSSGTGAKTPTGEFTMPEIQKKDEREAWYYIGRYRLYVQYASRIVDDILFHSLPSERKGESPTKDSRQALGERASHGCIRLRPADSRWIAENCLPGTVVNIYEGGFADDELRSLLLATSFDAREMSYDDFLSGEFMLSISSERDEVAVLQQKLNALGYACDETDGIFGAETHNAAMLWQQDNGYEPTGVIDESQYARLLDTPVPEGTAKASAEAKLNGRVKVDTALILRSQPSSKSEKLDTLPNGTAVRILDESGGWYKVSANGKTGYVGRNYIEKIK